jgi:hypothetical protein
MAIKYAASSAFPAAALQEVEAEGRPGRDPERTHLVA